MAWVVRAVGWRFAARRFGQALLILVLVTFGTTWILTQFSGDPCVSALGIGASEEAVQQCTEDRKLDESVFVQYGAWVGSVLSGDLGLAKYKSGIPLTDIEHRLPTEFEATASVHATQLGAELDMPRLYLKDESGLPTGSQDKR